MTVREARDAAEFSAAMDLRVRVFCDEQGVDHDEELDEHDETATQLVVVDEGGVVATCRLRPVDGDCKLERMVVERRMRGRGVGAELLADAEARARAEGAAQMVLNGQTRAKGFYAANGYEPEGEPFMEAGIEHIRMTKPLEGSGGGRPVSAGERVEPEIRIDQLTGLRTILAAGRADRPIDFVPEGRGREAKDPSSDCPFCEGNEGKTPPETWADRPGGGPADSPGWRVRAVPNLYPALAAAEAPEPEDRGGGAAAPADPLRASARGAEPDLFTAVPAKGVHEVVISSPVHHTALADLSAGELAAAVSGWRERMRTHAEPLPCVQLIVNEGGGAGASLEHTHAQLYALSFVPAMVAREHFTAYNQRTMGGDLLADIASDEVRRKERMVAIDDDAMVLCPWASRSPFELRVIPREVSGRFEESEAGAGALHTALAALRARFGEGVELNLWVRTAPRGAEVFHWHIDIAPRLAIKAGFELATGVDINIFPPERAAAELRESLG